MIPSTIVVPVEPASLAPRALAVGANWAKAFGSELLVVALSGEHDRATLTEVAGSFDASRELAQSRRRP